jgi:large subunit ribosomal protein L12
MEYVYAAMLLHKAGKPVTEENLNAVLNAAGVNPDAARVKALVAALEGVNIEEAIKTAPAFAAAAAPAQQAPAAPGKEAKPEEKKEKKPEEEKQKEEAALEGLGALFG